jgi:hypothetical protein
LFSSPATEDFRLRFQDIVTAAFDGASIQFGGWRECSRTSIDGSVRLLIYDDDGSAHDPMFQSAIDLLILENGGERVGAGHPRTRGNPAPGDDASTAHVVLSQTFRDSQAEFVAMAAAFSPFGVENLALSSGVHELGHVLGLRHEDAHPDRTCDLFGEDLRDDSAVVSEYNPTSFMSRCYYRSFNYDLGLVVPNALDIAGINTLYRDLLTDL